MKDYKKFARSKKYAREKERLKRLIEKKLNYNKIAKRQKCSASWVYQRVRLFGLRGLYLEYNPERRGSIGMAEIEKKNIREKIYTLTYRPEGAASLEEIGEVLGYEHKEGARQMLHFVGYYDRWWLERRNGLRREMRERGRIQNTKVIGYVRLET